MKMLVRAHDSFLLVLSVVIIIKTHFLYLYCRKAMNNIFFGIILSRLNFDSLL